MNPFWLRGVHIRPPCVENPRYAIQMHFDIVLRSVFGKPTEVVFHRRKWS